MFARHSPRSWVHSSLLVWGRLTVCDDSFEPNADPIIICYTLDVVRSHDAELVIDEHLRPDLVEDTRRMAITLGGELPEWVIFHTDSQRYSICLGTDHDIGPSQRAHLFNGL